MSIIFALIAMFGLAVAILAAGLAIVKPNQRAIAIAVAVLGIGITVSAIGFALLVISQMN